VVVHAHGIPRIIRDEDWLLQYLEELADKHGAASDRPWKVRDAPQEFTSKMLRFIVGVEMSISSLERAILTKSRARRQSR